MTISDGWVGKTSPHHTWSIDITLIQHQHALAPVVEVSNSECVTWVIRNAFCPVGDGVNYKERAATLLRSRCAHMGIDELKVSSTYDYLYPKLEEAKANLEELEGSLGDMYYAFDVAEVEAAGDPNCIHLYPHTSPSMVAWSGMFDRMLNIHTSELSGAERLALKMVNYMAYTECVYANVVNQLCHVLVYTNSPRCTKKLNCKKSMESIARDSTLQRKVDFLKRNLRNMPHGIPDISRACDIHMRNMIAHGSLAGSRPPVPYAGQRKSDYYDMSEPVYVRRPCGKTWKWDKKPVDLDVCYEKMCNATIIWHTALLHYQDVTYGSVEQAPES